MSDLIANFFAAWEEAEASARVDKIASAVSSDVHYDDPRTNETLVGIDALAEYVGMFNANAPGWSAKVVKSDTNGDVSRATVAFGGLGPDGNEQVQYGQYFVETANGLISRMVGFVGTGEVD